MASSMTSPGVTIVNFELISGASIFEFEQVDVGWVVRIRKKGLRMIL